MLFTNPLFKGAATILTIKTTIPFSRYPHHRTTPCTASCSGYNDTLKHFSLSQDSILFPSHQRLIAPLPQCHQFPSCTHASILQYKLLYFIIKTPLNVKELINITKLASRNLTSPSSDYTTGHFSSILFKPLVHHQK